MAARQTLALCAAGGGPHLWIIRSALCPWRRLSHASTPCGHSLCLLRHPRVEPLCGSPRALLAPHPSAGLSVRLRVCYQIWPRTLARQVGPSGQILLTRLADDAPPAPVSSHGATLEVALGKPVRVLEAALAGRRCVNRRAKSTPSCGEGADEQFLVLACRGRAPAAPATGLACGSVARVYFFLCDAWDLRTFPHTWHSVGCRAGGVCGFPRHSLFVLVAARRSVCS